MKKIKNIFLGGALLLLVTNSALAAPVFFWPSAYLSEADIPLGFYAGNAPVALENFEDGSFDFGITGSSGGVVAASSTTDSVDADDGVIDGFGTSGSSWFSIGQNELTFTGLFARRL